MKKVCIIFLSSIIILLTAFSIGRGEKKIEYTEYLRIHIRANSNDREDQAVKYEARDQVVDYLTPLIAECEDRAAAEKMISTRLKEVGEVANRALEKEGFFYGAKAEIVTEEFPTRVYDGHTFPAGKYRALLIYLGEGTGDNWWCVVYPPLCFSTTQNVVYKSKIAEIIKKWQAGLR